DDAAVLVPAADDVVQDVGGATVEGQISKLVANQEIGTQVALEPTLEGGHRLLLQKVRERSRQRGEADVVAGEQGGEANVLRQHGFADTGGASEEHVLTTRDEIQPDEPLDQGAVDLARVGPVEAVERLECAQ